MQARMPTVPGVTTHSPIIVLDSGLGGLTVVRAIQKAMPAENILYFGDTARLPYGNKSAGTVTAFIRQIINHLMPQRPKHVVIACNTGTALALSALRSEFGGLSISGVIDPGAKAAVTAAGAKAVPAIGVIATEATVRSKAYERAILRRRNHARVYLKPTPLLVPIIEDGRMANDPLVRMALGQYLQPLIERKVDVLVLGCTHYPIFRDSIEDLMGPTVAVIDSAEQCAEDVARRLKVRHLLKPPVDPTDTNAHGWLRCFVTDDPARFARLGSRFLGTPIEQPTWVSPDDLYSAATPAAALRLPA
jgi:glutamate racemase